MIAKTRITLLAVLLALGLHPALGQVSSNTFVRFHFYRGATALGDVDVELFDSDKPVSVSNFLRYVRSGAYDNLMLHRCEQGFVIQGGAVRTPNPLSTALFNAYIETPKFGYITNEFSVGPLLSNVFGTLAMARVAGDPDLPDLGTNSAQADWYFNLGDNSGTLDTNYGGFTVFGRAVAGTNVLDFFNRDSPTLDVLELGGPYFYQLPVAYADGHYPRFSEIYHVRITEMGVTDNTRPTIALTSPSPYATFTSAEQTVTGTATDNQQVSAIWYRHSYYDWDNSIGFLPGEEVYRPAGTNWTFPIHLVPGTNYISVQSVDNAGLRSAATLVRPVVYSLLHRIKLATNGPGKISGATNNQPIQIGKFINLTAVPAPNHMFAGWSGRYIWDQAKLPPVPMHSNLMMTATFVTNPFPPLKGTYCGLFFNPRLITNPAVRFQAHWASGSIKFTVSDYGRISGRLRMGLKTHAFSGPCSPLGTFSKLVNRPGDDPVFVNLVLDVTNRSEKVTGDVNDPVPGLNGLIFLSEVHAYRVRPWTTTLPCPFAGKHTFMIPGTNDAGVPFGDSWATATISGAGTVSARGALADNTPFSFSGPILTNGLLPFYTGHNAGRSSTFGWVQFNYAETNDDFRGQMHWFKNAPNPARPYPNGFQAYFPILTGSRYVTATSTNRVLNFSNAVLRLAGARLTINNPRQTAGDAFGNSVAASDTVVVVGAPYHNINEGIAYVYGLAGTFPTAPFLTLTNFNPSSNDFFGYSVAISGTNVVVGAYQDDAGAQDAGSVYVYDLTARTNTVPVATFNNPSPMVGDGFGNSVAISGTRVVVGASYDDAGATDAGSVYVYDLASPTRTVPVATLNHPSPAASNYFGNSVAISGARVVVGVPYDDTGATDAGSVYVYDLASATPTVPVATLNNPSPAVSSYFGNSVAISGTRVVVGASYDDTGATDAGIAYVYDVASATPTVPVATLQNPSPAANHYFGTSVAISGTRVVVGTPYDDTGSTDAGSAYVYDLAGATPTVPVATLNNPSPAQADVFGSSVAISGARLVVGATGDDTFAPGAGSAYAYDLSSGPHDLSSGLLTMPSTNDVVLLTNNTLLNLDTNKLTFSIVKSSGQFSGTVTPVNNVKSIPFKGVLLKKQGLGAGFFVSTNVSGQVYFGQ